MHRVHRAHGFTLVEVLVALVIMALMSGMAWQGVDGIVRTRDASQRQLEQTLRLSTVLGQWETDLAAVQDTGAVPPLVFDGATLRLTRGAEGGVQVVAWSLRPADAGNALERWAGPIVTGSAALRHFSVSSLTWSRASSTAPRPRNDIRAISERINRAASSSISVNPRRPHRGRSKWGIVNGEW